MKIVYILVRYKPNGKMKRIGAWVTRETAERHKASWENWNRLGYLTPRGSTFEIVEESR